MKELIFAILFSLIFTSAFAQVTQEWASIYNDPSNSNDAAQLIASDIAGNIYVTGSSWNTELNRDITTIKYNSSGVLQWAQRYNAPGDGIDDPTSLAVDPSGNVYVAGVSDGIGSGQDFITIKYNTFGVQEWVQRFNGSGNNNDIAKSICINSSGNICVTGSSTANSYVEIVTLQYNPAGNLIWLSRYNGSGIKNAYVFNITSDNADNIYVAGGVDGDSAGRTDYAVIKYNSSGVQQWVQTYTGPYPGFNLAYHIKVVQGNVYVTGVSNGPGISDYATVKYNSAGVRQWVQRYNGNQNQDDQVTGLAVDNSGNVYVTGYSFRGNERSDYATLKYNSNGEVQWLRIYKGPADLYDYAYGIALDNAGNIYVTGQSDGISSSRDCATIKYDPDGNEKWIQRYNGPANNFDGAQAILTDNNGNVYVTGMTWGNQNDFVTIKYSQQTGVNPIGGSIPTQFSLKQNYPNPFNPVTKINYDIPDGNFVSLKVYDVVGNEVETLVNERQHAGSYSVTFNAANSTSGVYFYKLVTEGFSETKKMLLVK